MKMLKIWLECPIFLLFMHGLILLLDIAKVIALSFFVELLILFIECEFIDISLMNFIRKLEVTNLSTVSFRCLKCNVLQLEIWF